MDVPAPAIDLDDALARLRAREAELRAAGVARLDLFGSVASGEAGPDSDIDLAAEMASHRYTLFDLGGAQALVAEILGPRAQLQDRRGLEKGLGADRLAAPDFVRVF